MRRPRRTIKALRRIKTMLRRLVAVVPCRRVRTAAVEVRGRILEPVIVLWLTPQVAVKVGARGRRPAGTFKAAGAVPRILPIIIVPVAAPVIEATAHGSSSLRRRRIGWWARTGRLIKGTRVKAVCPPVRGPRCSRCAWCDVLNGQATALEQLFSRAVQRFAGFIKGLKLHSRPLHGNKANAAADEAQVRWARERPAEFGPHLYKSELCFELYSLQFTPLGKEVMQVFNLGVLRREVDDKESFVGLSTLSALHLSLPSHAVSLHIVRAFCEGPYFQKQINYKATILNLPLDHLQPPTRNTSRSS